MQIDNIHTEICGVRFSCVGRDRAATMLLENAECGRGGYVCVTGAHGVVYSKQNVEFANILNNAWMNTLDGQPVVWLARWQGFAVEQRVTGRELLCDLVARDRSGSLVHGLLGATSTVTDRMIESLTRLNANVRVGLVINPPFGPLSERDIDGICQSLTEARVSVLWVGLSTPKQEILSARLSRRVPSTTVVAIGAGFDFVAGLKPVAPRVVTRLGLEWLFRLLSEPHRLARRYAEIVPKFIWLAAMDVLKSRGKYASRQS